MYSTFSLYQNLHLHLRIVLGTQYGTDQIIFTIMLTLIHFCSYSIINGAYFLSDAYGVFEEFKLSRKPYMTPKPALILKTITEVSTFYIFNYEIFHAIVRLLNRR